MSVLRIQLFGGLTLTWDDQPLSPIPGAAARSLLAYLVTFRDQAHARDLLASTFWPDLPDRTARRRLRQTLWHLRRFLGDLPSPVPFLLTDAQTVQFNPAAPFWLDVDDFVKSQTPNLKPQHDEPTIGGWGLGFGIWRDAVTLYRGDFLAGIYDDWVLAPRERLRSQYLSMLARLVRGLESQGDRASALDYARRLAAEDPLREEAHREVMRLCHLLGRPTEALKQYERCRVVLADELGVEPAPATMALVQEISTRADEPTSPHSPVQPLPFLPGNLVSSLEYPSPYQELPIERTVRHDGVGLLDEEPTTLPLIGRQRERATLLALTEQALAGHGGLVLVGGEAGVGKTRLLREIAQDAVWRGAQVAWGRGRELVPAIPYGVLTETLRAILSPLRVAQLAELVSGVWLRAASRVLPDLIAWLPDDRHKDLTPHVSLGPAQDRERLLEALTRTVLALGQIAPHVLILEDLHWADESTLAALVHLARQLNGSQVLVVGSYRSEEVRDRPAVWKALQALDRGGLRERLVLERLDAATTGELVRRGLGLTTSAPRFEARLYAETRGNPLFVLETLQALRDEDILTRDAAGAWRTPWDETTVDYAELPLPASVTQVVARRLMRLDPLTRSTLDVAAVLGGDFDLTTLSRVGRPTQEVSLSAVSELVRRRFLVEGVATYAFSHDLIRRVIYQALEDGERRRLHLQAGEALEALYPERVEALAHHFGQGGLRDKALVYTQQAGAHAVEIHDYQAALRHYERAAVLAGDDLTARWDVLARQEQVLAVLSRRKDQDTILGEMWDLAQVLDDPVRQARTRYQQGWREVLAGEPAQALSLLDEAARLARATGDRNLLGDSRAAAARAWWRIGDTDRCQAAIEQAHALFRDTGNRRGELRVLNMLGNLHLGLTGNYARALTYFDENRRIARELGDTYSKAGAHGNTGIAYALLGCYPRSLEMLAEAFEFMGRVGDRQWQGIIRRWQAANYRSLGDLARAQAVAEEALAICQEVSERNFEIATLELLGLIALDQHEPERALVHFRQAVEIAQTNQQWMDAAIIRTHLALAYLYLDHLERADQLSAQAITTLEGPKNPLGRTGVAYFRRYQIVAAKEGSETGRPYLEQAYEMVQAMAASIKDLDLRRSFLENVVENRAILTAHRLGRPPTLLLRQAVHLARADAPTGRPLRDDEVVAVFWTVAAPEDDGAKGKVDRRQIQLRRLLAQAAEQGAAPTVDDLATALGVSRATVKRDLAALRQAGYEVVTRGSRSRS